MVPAVELPIPPPSNCLTLEAEKRFMTIILGPHHVLFLLPTHTGLPLTDGVKQGG